MWSSAPCRRRWFHHCTHARVASSTWLAPRHGPRGPISSALYSPLTASASALSNESPREPTEATADRKSTRLNSSHVKNSYAVFCLTKKMRCHPVCGDFEDYHPTMADRDEFHHPHRLEHLVGHHHVLVYFFNDTATTEIYTLSLHDALPISPTGAACMIDRCCPKTSSGTARMPDRKSTRLNSSHVKISYAVFCLKKKKI